jgi:hypothetical protein
MLAQRGGAMRTAHALHHLPPEDRRRALEGLGRKERLLADRIERLMSHEELMTLPDPDAFADDDATVRTSEEGVEWELLTGPAPPPRPPAPAGGDVAPDPKR